MSKSTIALPLIATTLLLGSACSDEPEPVNEVGASVEFSASIQDLPGVAGVRFELQPQACSGDSADGEPWQLDLDGEAMIWKNGESPSDAPNEYSHMLGEAMAQHLAPGCYLALATPLDASGNPASNCLPAQRSIVVTEGAATAVDMLPACGEEARPEAEVQVNSPPTLDNLVARPEVSACDMVTICATASDVDHDMIDFVWTPVDELFDEPHIVTNHFNDDRSVTECIAVQPKFAGMYDVEVSVYDLAYTSPTAAPQTIEEITGAESHVTGQVSFEATLGCAATGRSAVILMTLGNQEEGASRKYVDTLIENTVDWVMTTDSGVAHNVLVILDDNHHGEHAEDGKYVANAIEAAGYEVDYMDEPEGGLIYQDIQDYAVVWFANPGYPMDDPETQINLLRYRQLGGGLVLQGDDMSRFIGAPDYMQPLTYLEHLNNGTVSCGVLTDNDAGSSYEVHFQDADHPMLAGLAGVDLLYGDDVDHALPLDRGEQVLAWAGFEHGDCTVRTPAVIALDPDDLLAWAP